MSYVVTNRPRLRIMFPGTPGWKSNTRDTMVAITILFFQVFVAGTLLADPSTEQPETSNGNSLQTTDDPKVSLERIDGHFLPSTFAILREPRLRDLLELSEEQQKQVDALLKQQMAVYLNREETEKPNAQEVRPRRRRRNFTLTGHNRSQFTLRDRELDVEVNQILTQPQQQQLARLTSLWEVGPMHPEFLYEQELELKLTKDQIEKLNALTSDWVILAAPKVHNVDALNTNRHTVVMEPVLSDAYEFQQTRDEQLSELLTEEQLLRLRQLALRGWIKLGPRTLYSPHTQESARLAIQRGGPVPHIAAYYRFDPDDLKLTVDQLSQLRQIDAEIDAHFRNKEYDKWLKRKGDIFAEVESLLTVDQIQSFRTLVGADHVTTNSQ